MNRAWTIPVWMGLMLAVAATALGNGIMLDGLSPRSIGRGGTNLGFADCGSLLADNPAAAVNIEGNGLLDIGGDLMLTDFHYSNPRNPGAESFDVKPLPQVAFIKKTAGGDWAYGLGLFVPAGFAEDYSLQGRFPLLGQQGYHSFGAFAKVLPGVAHRLTDRLSIGATLGAGINYVQLKGPYFLQSPGPLQGTPMLLGLQETGAALVWSVGFQYLLSDSTTLGLTYQSESRFELDGDNQVTIPGVGVADYHARMDITWPRSVGLGVRHQLCPHRVVAADVLWTNWSAAFDEFGLHMTGPSNPFFPARVEEQVPLRWRDTVSLRLGFEQYLQRGRVFRCGYVYNPIPVPAETLTPYIEPVLEHGFSVGYGFAVRCWNVDLAYMYQFGPEVNVGQSALVGGDFDQSTHRGQSHCISVSLMRPF